MQANNNPASLLKSGAKSNIMYCGIHNSNA